MSFISGIIFHQSQPKPRFFANHLECPQLLKKKTYGAKIYKTTIIFNDLLFRRLVMSILK
jgi:hypothetical protein